MNVVLGWLVAALGLGSVSPILEMRESESVQLIRVRDHLNELGDIRILSPNSAGNGHQALAVTIAKKLRQWGYVGKLELAYHLDGKAKFEFLLPPFQANGPDHQFVEELQITLRGFRDDMSLVVDPMGPWVPLLIIAGPNQDLHNGGKDIRNAGLPLLMTPAGWGHEPGIYRFAFSGGPDLFKQIHDAMPLRSAFCGLCGESKDGFLFRQMSHSDSLMRKVRGLSILLHAVENGQIDLQTSYGFGLDGVKRFSVLLKAIRQAQNGSSQFPKRVMVGLLSNLNESEWSAVRQTLGPNAPRVLDISRPDELMEAIANKTQPSLSVIKIGPVPQDVWHLLMVESALPPTIAGSSGFDFLTETGKPFIVASSRQRSHLFSIPKDLLLESEFDFLTRFNDRFLIGPMDAIESGDPNSLAHFIAQAYDLKSGVARAFIRRSHIYATLPNRLCQTLLVAFNRTKPRGW